MHWDSILLLALLAILIPWRSRARVRELLDGPPLSSTERLLVYISTVAFQWVAAGIVLGSCFRNHLRPADLGFALPHPVRSLWIAALLSAILILNQVVGLRRLATLPREKQGIIAGLAEKLLPRSLTESCVAICLVITVAICEEVIYRGFVQTVFENAFTVSVGIVASAAFFAIAHLYQGRRGVVMTFLVGVLFSLVRVWTGSLLPSIIAHFAVDFSAGLAAPRLLSFGSEAPPSILGPGE